MISNLVAAALLMCAVPDSTVTLSGVTVTGNRRNDFQMKSSQSGVQVSHDYLQTNFAVNHYSAHGHYVSPDLSGNSSGVSSHWVK